MLRLCCRVSSLRLAAKTLQSPERGSLTCLSLDNHESRLLLASTVEAAVAIYDVLEAGKQSGSAEDVHKPVGLVDKSTPEGHKFSISSVAWYPVDTGLFVSGSYDHSIKVRQDC